MIKYFQISILLALLNESFKQLNFLLPIGGKVLIIEKKRFTMKTLMPLLVI